MRLRDRVEHRLRERRLDGDIDRGHIDARPIGAQHDVRGLGIEPEVEFVARVGGELRIVGLRIEAAAHEHNAFGERGKLRIDGDGQRDVGQRPGGVDRHLVRMRAHLADEEVRGVFVDRLDGGHALGHGRNLVRPMRLERGRRGSGRGLRQHVWTAAPGAQPGHFAVERRLQARLLLGADQRKHCASRHGHVGVAGELQHAQGVQSFFVAPRVAGHHGDAQDLHVGRLQQRQHRHLVRAAGAGAVLIDEDEALLRGKQRGAAQPAAELQMLFS